MKRIAAVAVLSLAFIGITSADPAASPEQQMKALVAELKLQQTQLVENQAKIDGKLASIAEALRIARIFASRGGH
ncbi:MAG: hypothetical protein M3Y80_01995 [Verrucomicrobiota bacterium]|nr:hypothetical protein [Verrucomicrobiota bacterium]